MVPAVWGAGPQRLFLPLWSLLLLHPQLQQSVVLPQRLSGGEREGGREDRLAGWLLGEGEGREADYHIDSVHVL